MSMKLERLRFDFKQEASAPEVLEIRLYGEICGDRENWWTGEVTESKTSQEYFAKKLDEYKDVKQIKLYINSEGGSVEHGYGIYANLKRHPAEKTCYVDGFANSVASIIAMACDKIIMYPNSIMGIHNISEIVYGNASELRKAADDLDRIMEGNREIYLLRSNGKITLKELTKLLDEETFLTAAQCLEYGFCDEIDDGNTADDGKIRTATENILASAEERLKTIKSLREAASAFEPPAGEPHKSIKEILESIAAAREDTKKITSAPAPKFTGDDMLNCMMKNFEGKKE